MRFVASVWLLILLSLGLFSLVVFFYQSLSGGALPSLIIAALLTSTWAIGLASAATVHMLYLRAERAVEQAARDQTIVELAGAVAHELNQPLTVVISSAELLSKPGQSTEEVQAIANRMVDASQRMADIVARLQHATRYSSKPYVGSVRIVDLDKAV